MTASSGAQHECGTKTLPNAETPRSAGDQETTFSTLAGHDDVVSIYATVLVPSHHTQQRKNAAKEETAGVPDESDDVFPDADEATADGDGDGRGDRCG